MPSFSRHGGAGVGCGGILRHDVRPGYPKRHGGGIGAAEPPGATHRGFCLQRCIGGRRHEKAARRLGLEIPQELSVVGFDDSTICAMLEPELSSAHVDCRRMGELSMERMTALLSGAENVPRLTVVPVELRVRASSRART